MECNWSAAVLKTSSSILATHLGRNIRFSSDPIIELSELDSLSNSDVARIKAFMSTTTDRFRPPYGMRLVESPPQCVFAGTVNHSTYLRDGTGGRRLWPVGWGRMGVDELGQCGAEVCARSDILRVVAE